ncbi:hypothetical protein DTO212C5_4314 [Paecilomyces variotii]|nr:hypothetical protein DTO212C5_4314 [Paecilomyces variotii]
MTSAGSALNRQATKTVKSWRSGGGWNSCFKLGNASTHLDPFPSSNIPILDNSRGWADNWRGVRIPGSSSVGQRLAQAAFLASRERPSRGAPPTTRRVAVSVGVLS